MISCISPLCFISLKIKLGHLFGILILDNIQTGGKFDLMSRRVVCASSEKLAKDLANKLELYELERD